MNGGKNRQPLGYTIIEVMIVLAISGVMFLIATQFINGKQAQTAFNAGTQDTASQIQNVIEQVTDGKYSDIPLTCKDFVVPTISAGAVGSQQGTNSACVFLGKFLHFRMHNDSTHSNYEVFSLATLSYDTSLTNVAPIVGPTPGTSPDLTVQTQTAQGLGVNKITAVDANGSTHLTYGFGFTQGLGTSEIDSHGNVVYESGGQTISLVYAPNLVDNQTEQQASNQILAGGLHYAKNISVCLSDGSRYANILLGGSNSTGSQQQSQLEANVEMLGSTPC